MAKGQISVAASEAISKENAGRRRRKNLNSGFGLVWAKKKLRVFLSAISVRSHSPSWNDLSLPNSPAAWIV